MFKHNLTISLNKQRPDKEGRLAVRIRSTVKGVVTYYPTGIMVLPIHWDDKAKKVILHPNRNILNASIAARLSALEDAFLKQSLSGVTLPKVSNKKETDFFSYADRKVLQLAKVQAPGTIRHKVAYLNKLRDYRARFAFSEINKTFMYGYEDYCRRLGNSDNTIWSSIKHLRTFISAALQDGVIEKDPLVGYKKPSYKNPVRDYLTADELKAVEKVAAECDHVAYRNAANWFLFTAYSGLRYGDAKAFTPDSIVNGKIIVRTEKTGSDLAIKVHPKLAAVIQKLPDRITSNQDYNRALKAVAALAGISKGLTSHIGRHTFAVQYLERGGSVYDLSKFLGHSTVKTTEIYAKITDKRMDSEIVRVFK